MNGYEGDLRAFLIKAQHALSGKKDSPLNDVPVPTHPSQPPRTNILPLPVNSSATGYSSPYGQGQPSQANRPTSPSPFTARHLGAASAPIPVSSLSAQHLASSTPLWDARQPGSAPLHPAIRPQFGGSAQQSWASNSRSTNTPQRQAPPAVKAPAFHKQSHSPIPLPPYVKQMTASATNAPKSSPLSRPPQQAATSTPKPATEQPSTPSVRQPPPQKAPPNNPPPVQQRVDVQPTNPFAHPQNSPMNNYPVQVPMHHHHVQQNSWAAPPPPAHYDGNQGAPQSLSSRMMPPPSSTSVMHQQHTQQQHPPMSDVSMLHHQHNQHQHPPMQDVSVLHQQHNQQQYSPMSDVSILHQQNNQHQHPPMSDGYNHYMPPPPPHMQQQQQPMHYMPHMQGVNVPSHTENYYPPPPVSAFSYPEPPPDAAPEASGYPMIPSEDSQALLEKMMMNLKKATGQLGGAPT